MEALSHCFEGDNITKLSSHYYWLLGQADEFFAQSREETDKARSAVKLLLAQEEYFVSHNTIFICVPAPLKWLVQNLEDIVDAMKDVAQQLGQHESVKKIGSVLFDPIKGAELQIITDVGLVFVDLKSCTTKQHLELAKIAAFIAHYPPKPKVRKLTQLVISKEK